MLVVVSFGSGKRGGRGALGMRTSKCSSARRACGGVWLASEEGGLALLSSRRQRANFYRASARLSKICAFKHASRRLRLMLSIRPVCCGLPQVDGVPGDVGIACAFEDCGAGELGGHAQQNDPPERFLIVVDH